MFGKYLNAFFKNIKYVPDGLRELSTPVEQFFYNVFHSTVFRILYFIPFAILKFISIVVGWYYENFMNNELMLQSPANRVIFIYLIPAVTIICLIALLNKNNGFGWNILLASPFIFALFPFFVVWGVYTLILRACNFCEDNIDKKKEKLFNNPPKDIREIKDERLIRGKLGEKILEYALKKVPGYKRILTNLYVPINNSPNEYTEVDAVLVNKRGVFVWDSKNMLTPYIYGGKDDEVWYKSDDPFLVNIVEKNIKAGKEDRRVKTFMNPLKQNRIHVNAIQKQLRINNFGSLRMFHGIAFANICEKDSYIDFGADERACDVNKVVRAIRFWGKLSDANMGKREINKVADFLTQFENQSEEIKESHIQRLQAKYGMQSENNLEVNQMNVEVIKRLSA